MNTDFEPIIIEEIFQTTAQTVWKAITEIEQIKQWFFGNIPDFKAIEGFKTQFVIQNEERIFTHLWEIIEVIPFQKISYSWKYLEYEGTGIVTFDLSALENNSSSLKLTYDVSLPFPDGIPEFKRESGVAGWTYFISGELKKYLQLH